MSKKKIILSKKICFCRSLFAKATGLMFRFPGKAFAYIFPFSRSRRIIITMMFVFFPIDILFLDKNGVVIERVKHLIPFSSYPARKSAYTFVELPSGSIDLYHIQDGSKITWTENTLFFE